MNPTLETEFRPTTLPRRYSAERTFHHVDFFCDAPGAAHVCLVGDFNGWDMAATPMGRMPDGRWMASLELHHGHHQYLFVVDGEHRLDSKQTASLATTKTNGFHSSPSVDLCRVVIPTNQTQ